MRFVPDGGVSGTSTAHALHRRLPGLVLPGDRVDDPGMEDELAPIRGEIRSPGIRRVSHGLFLPLSAGLDAREEWRRELSRVAPGAPRGRCLHPHHRRGSLRLVAAPAARVRPRVRRHPPRRQPSSPGRAVLLSARPAVARSRSGTGCRWTRRDEVLLRAARDLGLLDLVVMVDAALHRRDVTPDSLADICRSSRPGVRRLRVAVGLADGRSESAWETALRLFHRFAGIEVSPRRSWSTRTATSWRGSTCSSTVGSSPTSTTARCTTERPRRTEGPAPAATDRGHRGTSVAATPPPISSSTRRSPCTSSTARWAAVTAPVGFGAGRDGWRSPASPSPDAADCRTGG